MTAPASDDVARWADIRDDPEAIVACSERWKSIAAKIGCQLHGFNDGRDASFLTPDGDLIKVGPKFRAAIAFLSKPAGDVERLRALVEESLYHLRLDRGAKAYHDKALAALAEGNVK